MGDFLFRSGSEEVGVTFKAYAYCKKLASDKGSEAATAGGCPNAGSRERRPGVGRTIPTSLASSTDGGLLDGMMMSSPSSSSSSPSCTLARTLVTASWYLREYPRTSNSASTTREGAVSRHA